MRVVLISTYEMGRQPFGLASPAAWLRARGHEVWCADVAISPLPSAAVREADLIAFHLPMHTATRLAARLIPRVRELNAEATLAAYGLYAPINQDYLRSLGVAHLIGGEFEAALADLADRLANQPPGEQGQSTSSFIPLERLQFVVPDRTGLPGLSRYAKLCGEGGAERSAGYTEASRGCKHLCRHCPVVPVYRGAFRVVQAEVVLEDIRRQVAAGATHITFGDPDFLNGPAHALRVVEALHRAFPQLTYDVTIKIEHLLRQAPVLPVLRDTGCLFVTSAVESVDDTVLEKLEKHHTREDFRAAVRLCRDASLLLNPTFIAFTPWTTRTTYLDLLSAIRELDLIDQVAPVQLALRLLITNGSRLLEMEEIRAITTGFDGDALTWRWRHRDPEMDTLAHEALRFVDAAQKKAWTRREIFAGLWSLAGGPAVPEDTQLVPRAAIPYLNEPWYC